MTRPTLRPPAILPLVLLSAVMLFCLVAVSFALGTAAPTATPSPALAAQADATPTAAAETTPAATAEETPAPVDPLDKLNVLGIAGVGYGAVLVKQDPIQLDGDATPEILLTVSLPITTTQDGVTTTLSTDPAKDHSAMILLRYNPGASDWEPAWQTPAGITGRAVPLPSPVQAELAQSTLLSIWQGKNLLRDNRPIFMLRTHAAPAQGSTSPTVELRLYAWNGGGAEPLRVAGAAGDDHAIRAASDVMPVDLDADGVYEIVADSGAATTIWRWDGGQYVPEEAGGAR